MLWETWAVFKIIEYVNGLTTSSGVEKVLEKLSKINKEKVIVALALSLNEFAKILKTLFKMF